MTQPPEPQKLAQLTTREIDAEYQTRWARLARTRQALNQPCPKCDAPTGRACRKHRAGHFHPTRETAAGLNLNPVQSQNRS